MLPSFRRRWTRRKPDAERVRKEFVESLPPDSPAYDAEWTTRYGSKGRLIFEFSVVLDLDGDDFDIRDYPGEAADAATADLRRRVSGSKVGKWGVFVVTVTGRPRRSSDFLSVSPIGDGHGALSRRRLQTCRWKGGLRDNSRSTGRAAKENACAHLSLRGTA